MFSFARFGAHSLTVAVLAAAAALPGVAHATVTATVTYSAYGLPTATGAVNGINLSSAPLGSTSSSGITFNSGANAVTLSTYNGAAVVNGSVSNAYAAPVTGGTASSPTYLTSNYLSTGTGFIFLSFASEQSYLGLLWGSVGAGDTLSFYDLNGSNPYNALATVTGAQAMAAPGFNGANGSQGFNGSEYALVNLTGGTYNLAVLTEAGQPSFEAGSFQYAAVNQSVPVVEPMSLALLGAGLFGVGFVRYRRAARQTAV